MFEWPECFYLKIRTVIFFLAAVKYYAFQRIRNTSQHLNAAAKLSLPFLSRRFPLEWHSDRTCNTIGARNCLQRGHQL